MEKLRQGLKQGIVIENSRIPQMLSWVIDIGAITLYPFIIFRGTAEERVINHERIHIAQQKELLVIPFYILYGWFWLVNRIIHRDSGPQAYYNIPFEVEAYHNDADFTYIESRPRNAWKEYFISRNN